MDSSFVWIESVSGLGGNWDHGGTKNCLVILQAAQMSGRKDLPELVHLLKYFRPVDLPAIQDLTFQPPLSIYPTWPELCRQVRVAVKRLAHHALRWRRRADDDYERSLEVRGPDLLLVRLRLHLVD